MLLLRRPRPDEADALTELCLESKAAWGYDQEFMNACRDELTLTSELVRSSQIQVAEDDGLLVGVAQVTVHGDVAVLDELFVKPTRLRSGIGRKLFDWATCTARRADAAAMAIESDPGAAAFYRRMGAVDNGVVSSASIPGRFIPRLKLSL